MTPFLGQIIMFGGNFAIANWAYCNGQLLPISQNTALFSLLGTTFGGDGRTTFALPDFRGRVPVNRGSGPGLSNYRLGQRGGVETHTLTTPQMPSHNHSLAGATLTPGSNAKGATTVNTPDGHYLAQSGSVNLYSNTEGAGSIRGLGGNTTNNGGNQPFDIRQPYLAVSILIALQGIYPPRS